MIQAWSPFAKIGVAETGLKTREGSPLVHHTVRVPRFQASWFQAPLHRAPLHQVPLHQVPLLQPELTSDSGVVDALPAGMLMRQNNRAAFTSASNHQTLSVSIA